MYNRAMPGTWSVYIALGAKIAVLGLLAYWGKQCFDKLKSSLEGEAPGVETSWGGLGGSIGGWSMTKSLVWLLLTALTVTMFALVALQVSGETGGGAEETKTADAKAGDKKASEPKKDAGGEAKGDAKQKTDTGGTDQKQAPTDTKQAVETPKK